MPLGRWLLLVLLIPVFAHALPETEWSDGERREIDQRLERFYANPTDAKAMNQRQPKYDAATNQPIELNPFLKLPSSAPQPREGTLEWLAQRKATPQFQKQYQHFLDRHFPKKRELRWASGEGSDRVEDLAESWANEVTYDLDAIPSSGKSDLPLWSDDYWPTKFGLTSYRYGKYDDKPPFKTYKDATGSYQEPSDWLSWLNLPAAELTRKIVDLSPAEKYDLTVGDERFSLTSEQKREGLQSLDDKGDVEEWMGICHGWSAAAIMTPRPVKPVTVVGARGASVEWYPADIRALATLAWANGEFRTSSIGGRCTAKHPKTYPNGRLQSQTCFDNNPSTFHLALGNLIGRAHASFVMDKAFDYEVWNQPVYSYRFTYFNPLQPSQRSESWKKVAVPYDARFKAKDRFQHPMTRGVRTLRGYSDRNVKLIVGVIATVTYLSETYPNHAREPQDDVVARESYTYDLELYEFKGHYYPEGGEWHENAHPDFLWLPGKRSFATHNVDNLELLYDPHKAPQDDFSEIAQSASRAAYPLCQVVKQLVDASSDTHTYRCATDR